MSTYYLSDPGNLEAFLWYFFEDDPGTTHRLEFQVIDEAPAWVRYDSDADGEFISGAIHVFGGDLTWDSSGLTGGTIEFIDFWYGEAYTYWGGSIWESGYSAHELQAAVTLAMSAFDADIESLAYLIGSDITSIVGWQGYAETYVHTAITPNATIYLGGGDDVLVVGVEETQSGVFDGGVGSDRLLISHSDAGPGENFIDLSNSTFTDLWGTTHSFDNFEIIEGSDLDDFFYVAVSFTDVRQVNGGAGDDSIYGGSTSPEINGGEGNDTIDAATNIWGGQGDDTIIARAGSTVYGGAGNDTIEFGQGNSVLSYSELSGIGQPGIYANLRNSQITFEGDTDTILKGTRTFRASSGDDTILGMGLFDQIYAGDGADEFHANQIITNNRHISIYGEGDDDTFIITQGGYWLHGGSGSDTFEVLSTGGNGVSLGGGLGGDRYILHDFNINIQEQDTAGVDVVQVMNTEDAAAPWDIGGKGFNGQNVEVIEGTDEADNFRASFAHSSPAVPKKKPFIDLGSGDDRLFVTGTESAVILGRSGNDEIRIIHRGDNLIDGGSGADTMDGGNGSDTYVVDSPLDVVHDSPDYDIGIWGVDLVGIDTILVRGADSFDFTGVDWTGVERIMAEDPTLILDARTYSGDIAIVGADGKDTILGGDMNASITGGGGGDLLIGDGGLADYAALFPELYADLPL